MNSITQQINIRVLEETSPLIPPDPPGTGAGLFQSAVDFIAGNIFGVIIGAAILLLLVLGFVLLRRRFSRKVASFCLPSRRKPAKVKWGLASFVVAFLSVLALQFVSPVKAASTIALDTGTLDITIVKPELSTTASDQIAVTTVTSMHDYTTVLISISDSRISVELNGQMVNDSDIVLAENSRTEAHDLDYTIRIADDLPTGEYTATITHNVFEVEESFMFTIDTRMTSTLDTDPSHYSGTATSFSIPTSGYVGGVYNHAYDWIVDWGDGTEPEITSGIGASGSNGIIHNYATPGEYQITIQPNGIATDGWMNAFGFAWGTGIADQSANKRMFKSIDTPLPYLSRTKGATHRFANMFYEAYNAIGIPADLFSLVDTSGDRDVSDMFSYTFHYYAYYSTATTIPAGLFDSINTANATDVSSIFDGTFGYYAYNSTTATIPAGLFDSINTANATNVSSMFRRTFGIYANDSTAGTIPAGLFDSINTANATNVSSMFDSTFYSYARYSSTAAAIPAGLFDSINTDNATNVSSMFASTFGVYARNSTSATIPAGLFDSINTDNATNVSSMFSGTFGQYAYDSTVATIPAGLFDSINTVNATNVSSMFANTFLYYAFNSTVATIPAGLFDFIDLSNAVNVSSMFYSTFVNYAYMNTTPSTDINAIWGNANFAGKVTASNAYSMFDITFQNMRSLTGSAQAFIDTYLGGINPDRLARTFLGSGVTDLAALHITWK